MVRCLDFADQVLDAYQHVVHVQVPVRDVKPDARLEAKHKKLEAGCRSGSISAKVVDCVMNLNDKTTAAVMGCLPEKLKPSTITSASNDNGNSDLDSDSDLDQNANGDDVSNSVSHD